MLNHLLMTVHWLACLVVLVEALNKLERCDPLAARLSPRSRFVVCLKAVAWIAMALGSAGGLVRPALVASGQADPLVGSLLLVDRPSLVDLLFSFGFAVLIVRSRLKEHSTMHLSDHFTVAEFTASDTAARLGIDNSLPASLLPEAQRTCEMLERIRAHLGKLHGAPVPLMVTSGYRCLQVNTAIGSDPTSDHVRALAVDFKAPAFGSAYDIARALAPHVSELDIGQLIHEFGSWVHVSTRRPDKQLNRIITISRRGTAVGVVEA